MKPSKLYTADGYAGPALTIRGIAQHTGVSLSYVYTLLLAGKPVGGLNWVATGQVMPRRTRGRRVIKLLASDDFPGKTFTQDEVRTMGGLKPAVPLQPYVRKGTPIAGHVWRFAGTAGTGTPGGDNVAPPPAACRWRKNGETPVKVEAPAPRRWVYSTSAEAYDVLPVNPMRLSAKDGPAEVNL